MSIYQALDSLFGLVQLLLIIRILLSWFPNIDWWKQPFKLLHEVTEPILAPFRRLIPPLGGLDLSPIFAFLALQVIQSIILGLVQRV